MTRCAGSQGTGFACMAAGMQEPLAAARSVCALVSALAGGSSAPAASPGDSLASGTPAQGEVGEPAAAYVTCGEDLAAREVGAVLAGQDQWG